MKIINKQLEIPKTTDLTHEYILSYFGEQKVIRWAIVETTDTHYIIDSAVEVTD
jgi:hypothetical protein